MAKLIVLPPAARFLKKLKDKQLKLAYQQAIDLILSVYKNDNKKKRRTST